MRARIALLTAPVGVWWRAAALLLLAAFAMLQASAQAPSAYVVELQLVSSTRITRDLSDFTYRIRVVNQGGALVGARALVRSLSANTVIRDNEVVLGSVPAGTTITSTDTFTLRQNRLVAFRPSDLVWTFEGQPANTRPVANAGPDQTVRTGTVVTLDGTGSTDADGQALSYRWSLLARPAGSAAVLSSTTAPRPTFTVDRGGDYIFRLVVNDGQVDSVFDEVQVSTLNSAPIANAGADRTVARGSLVTLDGSASTDPDFDALAFRWSVTARPNGSVAALSDATAMQPQIRLDLPGEYRFALVVNDGEFDSSADSVAISTDNSVPVARPAGPATATRNQVVTLDGSASADADGDPLEFIWSWTSRPAGSAAVLDVTDNLRPVFTPDVFGDYVVQLIVNDGWANSAPATVTVAVPQPPNRAPNAVADSASTPPGVAIDIAVLANDSDPDGDALTLAGFTQPSNGSVVQLGSALRFTPASGFSGSTSFGYTISDGRETASALVTVTVVGAANTAPTVFAGADQDITAPYANATLGVSLAGSVSDDGRPTPAQLTTLWSVVAGPGPVLFEGVDRAATRATLAVPGTYTLRLTASDGALSGSDELELRVGTPGNRPPVLAPLPDRTLAVGESLAVPLAADDPDPEDQLTFSLVSGPAGAVVDATGRLRWTATAPGSFGFTVAVRDAGGLGGNRSFTATVTSGNRAPVFVTLTDDRTAPGATYRKTLAATDPDGDAPLSFTLLGGPAGLTLAGAQISWQPSPTQIGSFVVQLAVRDPAGAQGVGVYSIDVESNGVPVARDDTYTVRVGETLTVAGPGVLANDADPEGSSLTARGLSSPALGSLAALNADGGFTYVAPTAFTRQPIELVGRPLTTSIFINDFVARQIPTIGDADGDGRPEFTYVGQGGPVVSLRGGSGAIAWTSSLGACGGAGQIGGGNPGQVLADVDDDGALEYVIRAGCVGNGFYNQLVALDARTGAVDWISPEVTAPIFTPPCDAAGNCGAPIRMRDSTLASVALGVARLGATEGPVLLARDHVSEFAAPINTILGTNPSTGANIIGTRYYGCEVATGNPADRGLPCNVTYLISGTDGSVIDVLRALPTPRDMANTSPLERLPPLTADLDGDGDVEIISGSEVWTRQGGEWVLDWQLSAEPNQTVVVDLDLDGRPEIVHLMERRGSFAPSPFAGFTGLIVYNGDGAELRRIPMPLWNQATVSAADVDGDGTPELLWQDSGTVRVLGGDGALRWTFEVPDHPTRPLAPSARVTTTTNLVVYDLDGDGARELAFNGGAYLFVLDAATGVERARFDVGFRSLTRDSTLMLHVTDWDGDGHADLIATGNGNNTPGSPGTWVITSARNDWLPAPTYYGASAFRSSGFDASGRVLFDTSVPRDFRNPRQLGTVADLRETQGTSFQYVANDGSVDSAPARVFLRIAPPNSPPVITSTPPSAVNGGDGGSFAYAATATDPDVGDTITWSARLLWATNFASEALVLSVNPSTGVLSINRNLAFGNFEMLIQLTATDSQGASTSQSFVVRHDITARTPLPSVVGASYASATTTLGAAGFIAAVLEERADAAPAGQVIAQSPLAGSAQTRGTVVRLTVSTGPAPALVPTVVGLTEGSAASRLTTAGFTVGAVSRSYSDTVPRGIVISQTPVAGVERVPGAIDLVVSAGSGVVVRLERAFAGSDQVTAIRAYAVSLTGAETLLALPSWQVSVAAPPTLGTLPSVDSTAAGSVVRTALATRGTFRITAVDPATGQQGSAQLTVGPPIGGGEHDDAAAIAEFAATLEFIDERIRAAQAAGSQGDSAAMIALTREAVNRWRALDRILLRLSTPFSPEGGMPPRVSDLEAAGLSANAADRANLVMLENGVAATLEMIEALRERNTPIATLDRRFADVVAAVGTLGDNSPGEFGTVMAQPEYRYLASILLPDWVDALMEDMARATGLPPVAALARSESLQVANAAIRAGQSGSPTRTVYMFSSLGETLTVLTLTKVVEEMNFIKKFHGDLVKQARSGAMLVGLASRLRSSLATQELVEVVAGPSLSFRRFEQRYSFIEGFDLDAKYPALNDVVLIGPETVGAVEGLADAIRGASFSSLAASARALGNLVYRMYQLAEAGNSAAQAGRQLPTSAESGCVFTTAPGCSQLQFANGFQSVYSYSAPAPLPPNVSGLPLPVIVIVRGSSGQFYLSTPPFLPFREGFD